MQPVHDVDAILLLSLSVAGKRRPANLDEIITAIDLAQDAIPSAAKLSKSFTMLSAHGLIIESDGGYTLSTDAQEMMSSQRKNDDTAKKLLRLKEHLADYSLKGEHNTIQVSPDQFVAVVKAYQAAKIASNKSMLTQKPKPKSAWIPTKELVQGTRHLPSKRRKP